MPIITVQRRMAEQGRIRLGQKVPVGTSGKTRPDKLTQFRFTSPNEDHITALATLYGGTAQAWDNAGKAEWEVLSHARSIPVIVVKGGCSQWHELWSKAGCLHRCDGEKDVTGTYCNPDDPQHLAAIDKPTTRLSVMLSELESLGVWRMESKGWGAAAELPSMAELAMLVGDYVPATLSLSPRSSIVDGPKGPQTAHFVVPVLDLQVTKRRLVALLGGSDQDPAAPTAVGGADTPAAIGQHLEQPEQPEQEPVDWVALIAAAATTDDCNGIWRRLGEADLLTPDMKARIVTRGKAIVAAETAPEEEPPPYDNGGSLGTPGAPTADAVWFDIVAEAGRQNLTDADVRSAFDGAYGHQVEDATLPELQEFLTGMQEPT